MTTYKEYFAIESKLKKQGFDIERSDVIKQFSNGRKLGLSQLTPFEYNELLRWLNQRFGNRINIVSNPNVAPKQHPEFNEKEDRQKKKIIALFCKMGYLKDGKADIYRINGWTMKYGHLHKKMNDYHEADLTKLVSQAEEAYKTFVDGLSK
jgi:hypothetical protein